MTRRRFRLAAAIALGIALLIPAVSSAGNCSKTQPIKGSLDFNGQTYPYQAKCKGDWVVIFTVALSGADFTAAYSATEDVTGRKCTGSMESPTGGNTDFKQQAASCVFDKDDAVKLQLKRK